MIGKLIYNILSTNAVVTALVPATKIYPYVLNENTDFPAIIYTVDGVAPEYTKDGRALDEANFSVVALSNNYASLQDIAVAIRAALEMGVGTFGTAIIQHIHMTNMVEDYNGEADVFASKLSFNVNVINY